MTKLKLAKKKTRERQIKKTSNILKNNTKKAEKPYEAYLYRYTYLPTGKVYVGIHKGLVTDNYQHSSTCQEFNELLADEPENFKFDVLRKGNYGTMQNAEHEILSEADAKNNDMYFNKSNGSPASKDLDYDRLMLLADEIRNMTGDMEYAVEVCKNTFIQVRAEDDYSHKHDIQSAIDQERGNTKKLKLQVVLLEGYFQEDEREYGVDGSAGIGGNHSARAAKDCKHIGTKIEVVRVPYEMWEGLDDDELQFLGMQLNIQEGLIKPKVNNTDDFEKLIHTLYYNKDYDLDGDPIREALAKFNIGSRQIEAAINRARKSIEIQELNKVGKKIRDWTVGADKKTLEDRISNYRADGKTLCYKITSGSEGAIQTLLRQIHEEFDKERHERVVVLVRHPNDFFYNRWRTEAKPLGDVAMLEFYMSAIGLKVEIRDLPHLIQDRQYLQEDI